MKFMVRKAAVLGAGVMGAQIAAHLANAGVPVILFDLAASEGDKSGVARKARDGLRKLQPAPLTRRDTLAYIDIANYDEHLPELAGCDLVIEAIAERMDWKQALYSRIAPHLAADAVIASNTSGLSIAALGQILPAALRPRFCGIHFFNPPRYMPLVEIIPTPDTEPALVDGLESWLTSRLGKNVVRALDTPNFVANRIGVFSLLAVMHHGAAFGLAPDTVDALTGPRIGRPKSATYRTGDVVGLDTLAHVVRTMHDTLPNDPWHGCFALPQWLQGLVAQGVLGQKTRGGVFRKAGKVFEVFDPAAGAYRPSDDSVDAEVAEILAERDPQRRMAALRQCAHPQARFLWAILRDVFHYCAVHLAEVADNARDLDAAMRWGFGWQQGPFELWQRAGWADTAAAIAADIAAGLTLSPAPLPAWVSEGGRRGVFNPAGAWSPRRGNDVARPVLPVYARQLFPEALPGEGLPAPETAGTTLYENEAVRLWCLAAQDARIGILSFKTRMHAIGSGVLSGLRAALAQAEATLDGLVLWHPAPFAVGADLKEVLAACSTGDAATRAAFVQDFQDSLMAVKYARIPVVAAVQGMALGGGCELAMQAAHRVWALESQPGLVEAGVGLIPAGGGCKELALRAARWAGESATPEELLGLLQPTFMTLARGKMAASAHEAIDLGFGQAGDTVCFHGGEILYVALRQARHMAELGHAPAPRRRAIPVAGRAGIAALEMTLVNMRDGGMISAHDYRVGRAIATALCGGEIEAGSRVSEEWLLAIERQAFLSLLDTPETQARIRHMLDNGKPLRN